jgi:hypothetical protein
MKPDELQGGQFHYFTTSECETGEGDTTKPSSA